MRSRRLASGKKGTLGTWGGGRPLFHRRGDLTCNLLGRGLLAGFLFVLAARAGARGSLRIEGGGGFVWVWVAGGEGGHVICISPVVSGLVAMGIQPRVLFRVTEGLAKLYIIERYAVFRLLSRSGGWCGRCSGLFLPLPRGAGAWGDKTGVGHTSGGLRLGGRGGG